MTRNRLVQRLALLLVVIFALSACGGNTGGGAATTPVTGGEATTAAVGGEATAAGAAATAAGETTTTPDAGGAAATPAGETTTAGAGASGGAGSGTITWAFWGEPSEVATHEKVAQAFMQEHPDITVETYHQPWSDYFTKMQTLWAGGDTAAIPDVMFMFFIQRYAADGVLENLDPWIQQSGYDLEDYWPNLVESAMYNGSVYGLPRDIGLEVLYYNKAAFDEAGVEYPTEEWSWEDLRSAAEQLTVTEGGRTRRYGLAMEGGKYGLWLNQNGTMVLDDVNNPSRCTLNDPEAVEALSFFGGMMKDGFAMRDADLSQAGGDAAVMQSGQAAMIIQNASRISAFNTAGLNYDVAPVPTPEGGERAAAADGAAWTMSSASDNKEAAWTFIQWLQSTEGGQRLYTESGEIFPALQSTARGPAFLESDQPPENRQAFLTEGENAKLGRNFFFAEWGEMEGSIVGQNLQRVWAGEATAEEVAPEICQQVDAFLQEQGYPKQQ